MTTSRTDTCLLLICDPASYSQSGNDIACFYRAASRHADLRIYHIEPTQVSRAAADIPLQAVAVTEALSHDQFLALSSRTRTPLQLDNVDVIFCRTLKPFCPGYVEDLSSWEPKARFLNRPSSKLRQLAANFLPELAKPFLPNTLVSADREHIRTFLDQHGIIVAKRSNSTGGRGVFRIQQRSGKFLCDSRDNGAWTCSDFDSLLSDLEQGCGGEPLLFSRFLKRTIEGDKRVIVVAGEIHGAYLRRSTSGHWVNNLSHDGERLPADVSAEELEAITATSPSYQRMGLNVLGYDFLLDDDGTPLISEINVGNVGGFASLQELYGQPAFERLLAWIQAFACKSSSLIIRLADGHDDAAIAAIFQDAIDQGGISMEAGPIGAAEIKRKREGMSPQELLIVAERNGEVIGWAEAKSYSPREGYRHCCETSIYLRSAEAGQGQGRLLQQRLMQWAAERGFRHLVARIVDGNRRSLDFHLAAGYEMVGVQRHIGFLNGRWHDVLILQRLLF